MHDALHGRKAWCRPRQRDRPLLFLSLSRAVGLHLHNGAWGDEADLYRLRFDGHALDMAFDQVAVGHRRICSVRCKVLADAVEHQRLDLGCGHTPDAAGRRISPVRRDEQCHCKIA